MSQTDTSPTPERAPSVLVVLVVRDAAGWLRECLQSLGAQTYPRLGVLAVDDASQDESGDILRQALGEARVLSLPRPVGLAGAVDAALKLPVVAEADYTLIVHDDSVLDADVILRMVEAAVALGVDRVGVVGAKIADREEPRRLQDVGRSADRFGHMYTPLQPGEIDQGQFDRVLEVLAVSSASMLVSRDAWRRVGGLDRRLDVAHVDLDFCWRARLAGFRVLMTPLAEVQHRGAPAPVDRPPVTHHQSARYEEDRAALASMLRNYGVLNLLWLVPLAFLLGLVRLLYLVLARRLDEAFDLVSAWGWNLLHLPGTLSLRRATQKRRTIKDRQLRRFMESAGLRLPRWFETAEQILEEQRELEEEDPQRSASGRLRHRTASFVGAHPVLVASFLGVIVGALAVRSLLGPEPLAGGVLPSFPGTPDRFFRELDSGYRTTGLGGSLLASPALGALGGLSALLFGSTAIAQKLMLIGTPALATVLAYRALSRRTGRPGPSVVAAAAYGLSALMLWSFSQGRLDLLVGLAVLPAILERMDVAFSADGPSDTPRRFVIGFGVTIAIGIAFFPGVVLAALVAVAFHLVFGPRRGRGIALTGLAFIMAAILVFPFVPGLVADGGRAFGSLIGTTKVSEVLRVTFGTGPGTWEVAFFLPVAALLGFALVAAAGRAEAVRNMLVGIAGLALCWFSAAGYIPAGLSDPLAYGALAAASMATLIALGLSSAFSGLGDESFGFRQLGTAAITIVLVAGIGLQAAAAMVGGWAVGGLDEIPASFAVASDEARGDYRVLWVGELSGTPFPPPGGDPSAIAYAGEETLRFALTGKNGIVAIDMGRPMAGPGMDALDAALNEILSGTTHHGGALLSPFGIRFVVAAAGDLPDGASEQLDAQFDLDPIPANDLVIYKNAAALPPAAVLSLERPFSAATSGDPEDVSRIGAVAASPLRAVQGGWDGEGGGPVVISTEYDDAWELVGSGESASDSFGWGTGFASSDVGAIEVRYGAQLPRTIAIALMACLWAVALWITRKPVAR